MDDWGITAAEMELVAQWAQSQGVEVPVQQQQTWTPQQQQTWTPQIIPPCMKGAAAAKGVGKAIMPAKGHATSGIGEDPIFIAINTAMANVSLDELATVQDGTWDAETLKRRLAKYFRSAAKNLNYSAPAEQVVNEFADAALGNVSWALQGTQWLQKADFTLVLEIAISELFPDEFKENHPGHTLEEIILKAHDRALEEALFAPVLLETVKEIVEGKKSSNKVHNAAEAVRRDLVAKINENQDDTADFFSAFENGVQDKIEEFVAGWIKGTLKTLGEWPDAVICREDCMKLFQRLVVKEDVCLPRSLVRYMVEPLPEDWAYVTNVINEIYDEAEANAEEHSSKRRKWTSYKDYDGPNYTYKTTVCRNISQTGYCKMGDWCVFAHDENELMMHLSGLAGAVPHSQGPEKGVFGVSKGGFGPSKGGFGPMMGGKKGYAGYGQYGKGAACYGFGPKGGCAKGVGYPTSYGKSSGKRYGKRPVEPVEEELEENFDEEGVEEEVEEEEENGEIGELDEEGGLSGPGAYAQEYDEP